VDLGLQGRVALVGAASKGIGRAVAAALVAEGAEVAVTSRSRERIEATAAEIGAHPYVLDSGDLDAVPGLVDAVESDLGPVDVLVTNTGGPPGGPEPLGFTPEQWRRAHTDLVLAPMALLERILPGMRERGFGRVLNIASSSVREPIPTLTLSTAHRSGMVGVFKTLAQQAAADGVTLNTIHPGRIATDRVFENAGSEEAARAAAKDTIPAGRLGTPEELAAVAAFLCSAPASYVTGTQLAVDGGLLRSV
jgi:3-oxoacyl-[acyl-carrier protein] reductase